MSAGFPIGTKVYKFSDRNKIGEVLDEAFWHEDPPYYTQKIQWEDGVEYIQTDILETAETND